MWIAEHLAGDLSAEALASRLNLSVRHFSRLFRQRTGTTAAAYVEAARGRKMRFVKTNWEPDSESEVTLIFGFYYRQR